MNKVEIEDVSMKPLLGLAIKEAVKLALIDCCGVDASPEDRQRWEWDIHAIPRELYKEIDPSALAQNIACRLMGTGGWNVRGTYAGNATPRQILESCIERPDMDPVADLRMDLNQRRRDEQG